MLACGKKAATASDQGINAGQIPLQMAQLLLNGLADLADARPLHLGHGQKLLSGFLAVRAWLIAKGFSDMRMHLINQLFGDLPGLIEQKEVCWVTDIGWHARGINNRVPWLDDGFSGPGCVG